MKEFISNLSIIVNDILKEFYNDSNYLEFSQKNINVDYLKRNFRFINDLEYYSIEVERIMFSNENSKDKLKKMKKSLEEEIEELYSAFNDLCEDSSDLNEQNISKVFEELGDVINILCKLYSSDTLSNDDFDKLYYSSKDKLRPVLKYLVNYKQGLDIPKNIIDHMFIKSMEMYVASLCKLELISEDSTVAQRSIVGGVHIGSVISNIYNKRTKSEIKEDLKKIIKDCRTIFRSKLIVDNLVTVRCWRK